jgi:hypothetical protein
LQFETRQFAKGEKKWQATHIAPLQPPILAVFLPWGGSAGAGRVRPAAAKVRVERIFSWIFFDDFPIKKKFHAPARLSLGGERVREKTFKTLAFPFLN